MNPLIKKKKSASQGKKYLNGSIIIERFGK